MQNRVFYIFIVFVGALFTIGFGYLTIKESRIWLSGERKEARILSIEKIDSDLFEVSFLMINSKDPYSVEIERDAYNNLKDETSLKIIVLGKENPEFIFLQLDSKNNVFKFLIGVVLFGLISISVFQKNLIKLGAR